MARATAHWTALSGENNWTTAADWDIGTVPTASDDVHFDGTEHYQVDITSAVSAYGIEVLGSHAILDESSAGSITAHSADFERGTIILNGTNDISTVDISTATVEVGADGALGRHAVSFDQYSGTIEAIADVTLHNAINMNDGFLAAAAGDTLVLDSDMTGVSDGTLLGFGSLDGTATGTVELDGLSYDDAGSYSQITIYSGTVSAGKGGHDGEANELFASVGDFQMDPGTTLDITNFGSTVYLGSLQGSGTVENNHGTKTIDVDYANFNGSITGRIDLDVSGTSTFVGHVGTVGLSTVTMGAGTDNLNFSGVQGSYAIYAPAGSSATINIGLDEGIQNDRFMDFQDGNLTIDTTQPSDVATTFIDHSGYVELHVNPTGPNQGSFNLYFFGVSSHDGFVLGDNDGHLQITYDPPDAAHVADAVAQASFVPLPHDVI
jgi:hypothetical protein